MKRNDIILNEASPVEDLSLNKLIGGLGGDCPIYGCTFTCRSYCPSKGCKPNSTLEPLPDGTKLITMLSF